MARVRNNVMVRGLSGSFGDQMVIRIDKAGRTIVSNKPEFDENRQFTQGQQEHQEAFREAAAYAKSSKTEEVYVQMAEGTPMNPYNVAMADWFHAPEIKDIDLSGWSGVAGETIRVEARDDVLVDTVTLVITDEEDAVLEQGSAVRGDDGSWWIYTTTATASGTPKVIASAVDLPGHIAQMTKSKE